MLIERAGILAERAGGILPHESLAAYSDWRRSKRRNRRDIGIECAIHPQFTRNIMEFLIEVKAEGPKGVAIQRFQASDYLEARDAFSPSSKRQASGLILAGSTEWFGRQLQFSKRSPRKPPSGRQR